MKKYYGKRSDSSKPVQVFKIYGIAGGTHSLISV